MTWPPPEPDAGVDDGELRPDDEPPEPERLEPSSPDEPPEARDPDVPDVACEMLVWAEAGRLTATTPAPIRLAAAAEIVTARTRARPRSLAAAREAAPGVAACWLSAFMTLSVPAGARPML